MRKTSMFVVIGLVAAGFGGVASAQDAGSAINPNFASLATSQGPAEFRTAPQLAPSPLSVAPAPAPSFAAAPGSAMTAPMAPGSGFTVDIPATGDAALAVQAPGSAPDAPQGFAAVAASGELSVDTGVPTMLGFDTNSSLTSSFAPQAPTASGVTLGR